MPRVTQTDRDQNTAAAPFEEQLRSSVQSVRGALAEVMASVGADATKPQQVARQIGLDKSLSWKLSRIVGDDDAYSTISLMPGKAGLRIVLRSFEKAGASSAAIESLKRAVAAFDHMVEVHCGSRDTLEMMLGNVQRDGTAQQFDETQRKKSFQGNSAIWGVQARVHVATHIIAPSARDADLIDFATISGLVDFRRLRSNVAWAVASVRHYSDDGSAVAGPTNDPIDPNVDAGEVPLLRDFCSSPLPPLRITEGVPGVTRYEIAEGPVGNTGSLTCLTGWINRGAAVRHRTETDTFGEHVVDMNTPAEVLLFDLYVHLGLDLNLPPTVLLYSQLPGGPLYPRGGRDRGLLPLREHMIALGAQPPDVVTPEVPRHRAAIDFAVRRLCGTLDDYQGYRLKIRFPPIPTSALFRHVLPEPRAAKRRAASPQLPTRAPR